MYELYKKIQDREEYFNNFVTIESSNLTENLKDMLYKKYVMKCHVFQRDNFKCQNTECLNPESKLTLHHIKFKKDGGEDDENNAVTLCDSCHKAYHKAKRRIVFSENSALQRIRGRIFKIDSIKKNKELDWKTKRAETRIYRKYLKSQHGIILSLREISILLKFLFVPYYEWDDD